MDPHRWAEVRALFDRVVDLDPARARGVLDEVRARDADLADRAEALLRADGSAGDLLDLGAERVLAERARRRVGAYRLVELLGTGGMGAVWRAERADGAYRGKVALKLIRTGFTSDELLRRFRGERQILASLASNATGARPGPGCGPSSPAEPGPARASGGRSGRRLEAPHQLTVWLAIE